MSSSDSRTSAATGGRRRRSLHRQALEILGQRIVRGDIPVGSRLPIEPRLGAELDVSRTVVREAVKVLAAKGLVATRPRTGTRVRSRASWDLLDHDVLRWIVDSGPDRAFYEDLFEVRRIIEPQAAALAAERRTEPQAKRLLTLLEALAQAGDDPSRHTAADLPLHAAILEASHNELLIRLSSTLAVALRAARDVTARARERTARSIPLHEAIVRSIIDREPAQARDAMEALIDDARLDMEIVLAADEQV